MSNPGPALLRSLIAKAQQEPAVDSLWVGGSALLTPDEPFLTLELLFAAPALPAWLTEGEVALARPVDGTLQVVTADGLDFTMRLLAPGEVPPPDRYRLVVTPKGGASPVAAAPSPVGGTSLAEQIVALAADFWGDLYRAGAAIGQARPFTTHAHLERCRGGLLAVYRLAAGDASMGWIGMEARLDGQRQHELAEWLVAPLNQEAQWRNAYRLAQRFEPLLMPLMERLGLPYPLEMRTLAFDRLTKVKPGAGGEGEE
jgi:hypothetical protein